MKLIEYLPNFLQGIKEFKELLNAEDIEVEKINAAIEKITDEVIVKNAQDYGLDRYEKIYRTSNIASDLTTRRLNILSKMNNRTPYTLKWLRSKLDEMVGKENYTLKIDYNSYTLTIRFDAFYSEATEIFKKDFKKQIPANILLGITLYSYCNTYIGSTIVQKEYKKLMIDTSTIIEKEQINNDNYMAGIIIQKEFNTLKIDNSIIREKGQVLQEDKIAISAIQKEFTSLYQDNNVIKQQERINNTIYSSSNILQKEFIEMKEEK